VKKLLLFFSAAFGFLLLGNKAFASVPTIAYGSTTYTFTTGVAITAITPSVLAGNPAPTVSITPALPGTMTINAGTGVISGTPSGTSSVTYTVKALNSNGNRTTTITIIIVAAPTLSYTNPPAFNPGVAITPVSPTETGVAANGFGTGTALTGATLNEPYGMAIDGSGNIYVTNYNNAGGGGSGKNTVSEYNSAGTYQGTFGTGSPGYSEPAGIVFYGTSGYVLNAGNGKVYKFTAGAYQSTIVTVAGATGIAIDAAGDIYLADPGAGKVYEYNNAGTTLIQTITETTPEAVAVDASGNIYILDNGGGGNRKLVEYSSTGTPIGTLVTGLGNSAIGLSVDASGNIYIGDTGTGNVTVYNSSGTLLTTVTGGNDPQGMVVDSKGNLYVSDFGNYTVTKYPPAGGYYITSGTLPAGLSFNSATGTFSGTPTATFATTTLTVTAYNAAGTAVSAMVTFSCSVPAPILSYTGTPYTLLNGAVTSTISITNTGGAVTSVFTFNLTSGALPTGITFNSADGSFTCTPTATGTVTGNVTGTNSGGTGTAPITITVNNPPIPVITYTSPQTYTTGVAITPLNPANTGGAAVSYAVSVATPLPTGLSLNTTTGQITGTPSVASPSTAYSITATNAGGTSLPFNLYITVVTPASFSYSSPNIYTYGTAITTLAPTGSSVPLTGATISPALPTGLSIGSDGTITGTPGVVSASTQYTVTATGSGGGVGTASFYLEVDPAPLTLTATGPAKTYGTALTTGTSTTNFTAVGAITGQTVNSVTLTPDAAGLSATTPAGSTYTVTPSNPTGTGGFLASNYTITVVPYSGTVSQKNLTITATGPTKTYGTALTAGTSTTNFTATGTIAGQTVTSVTLTPDANGLSASTPAGTAYVVSPSGGTGTGGFSASNYNITYNVYNGTVAQYPVTITANNQSKVYGTTFTFAGTEFTTSGLLFSDNVTSVTLTSAGSAATASVAGSPYTITPSAAVGSGLSNYSITYSTAGKMTVTGAPLTITATGPSKTYGTALTNGNYTTNFSVSGSLASGQNVTGVTLTMNAAARSTTTAAGATYTVTPSAATGNGGFVAGNYSITYVVYTGTVAQATLTVTASTNNKTYGTALTNGTITTGFTYTGEQNGERVNSVAAVYGTGAAATAAVGTYTGQITISGAAGTINPSNYIITYVTGNIVVGQATLTITANNVTKTIGNTLTGGPGSTAFTYTGAQNGETVGTVTITYGAAGAAGAGLGTYNNQVTPSAATGGTFTASNYNIVYDKGSITVVDHIPALTYNTPNVYSVNVAIPTLGPSNSGGTVIAPGLNGGTNLSVSPALNGPDGMAFDASGNLYVTNNNGTIDEFNSGGTSIGTFGSGMTDPVGIVFNAAGDAFVLDASTKKVYEFSSSGSLISTLSVTGLNNPSAIAINSSGNLYIANTGNNDVLEVNSGTGAIIQTITSNIYQPTGVAIDNSGNIYVTNAFNFGSFSSTVTKYNSSGTYSSTFKTDLLGNLSAISIDASGNIYVADDSPLYEGLYEYSSTGTGLNNIYGWNTPEGIVVDSKGDVFVSDNGNNSVTEYGPTGGYYLSGPLPPGLSFSSTTGQITGTPTSYFPTTSYTVTAYNSGGPGISNTFTISCQVSYDWVGTQPGGNWNSTANWASQIVPGVTDTAKIGVDNTFTYPPVVSTSGPTSVSVGWVLLGNAGGQAAGITVNSGYTLAVVNHITKQSDANSTLGYVSYLAGSGTIQAVNLNVVSNTTATAAYTESISSSVSSMQLSGNVNLTSNMGTTYGENAAFNVTGGLTSLTGTGATGIISTTNQTGSTSTVGVSAGTLQWANATGLSGLSATGTNTVSCSGTGVIGYSGASQTVYTDASIPGLATGVSYQGISFSGSGIKTPNGASTNNLNIAGNFTNSMANTAGNYVALYNTIVNFTGSGAQTLASPNGSQPYGTVFNTVNFSNAGVKTMSGSFYVAPTGLLTMSSGASLVAGDATTTNPGTSDAYLTLMADVDSAASVAQVPSGCAITGNVNVQRYISGGAGYRGYRLLSSPVYAGTTVNGIYSINYLKNYLFLTGSTAAAGGFQPPPALTNPTLYLYDEGFIPQYTTFYNSNYIAINSLANGALSTPSYTFDTNTAGLSSASIPVGNGYYCFYRGSLANETTAQLTNTTYTPLATSVTATGTLNQGSIAFKNWYNSGSYLGSASQLFNLVGNPYASAIDLEQVSATTGSGIVVTALTPAGSATVTPNSITSHVYELNPATGIYGVYTIGGASADPIVPPINGASEFIASGQGFFMVAASGGNCALTFNENAKATSANSNVPGLMARRVNVASLSPVGATGLTGSLLLKMSLDSVQNEESLILFSPTARPGFLPGEDAAHRTGEGLVGFSTISSDNIPLAINTTPLLKSQTIPLRVYATNDGLYNINLKQLTALPALYDIWLMDAYKKDSLDIKDNPTYNFDIMHADTNTFGVARLSLVIRQNPALMVHLLSFTALKATGGDNVNWTTENEANYTNFAVQRSTNAGQTFTTLDSLVSSGLGAYSYLDSKPVQGANSYRLQLTDLNGNITYSNVITIMYANTGNQIALNGFMVYPNPTAGAVNLSITQPNASAKANTAYTIQIVNNLGVVLKTAQSSSPQWQTDVSALNPGTYFITVMNANTNTLVGRSAFVKL